MYGLMLLFVSSKLMKQHKNRYISHIFVLHFQSHDQICRLDSEEVQKLAYDYKIGIQSITILSHKEECT